MTKNPESDRPPGSPGNPIPLAADKKLLQRYYSGERLASPMGGQLDFLGVREGGDGSGRVLLECNASSLRFVLVIPKATRTEKSKVKKMLEAGEEPHCPRHGPRQLLAKSGKELVCQLCAVSYGKVG